MNYAVRPMRGEDIPQAQEIEQEAFPTQWPPTPFKREINNRLAHYFVVVEGQPKEPVQRVEKPASLLSRLSDLLRREQGKEEDGASAPVPNSVGLVGFWMLYDEAHITSIAVRASHRRRSLGELLLVAAIEKALALNARVVTLEVRVTNFGAQALYEKYGFRKAGIRRGYYTDNNEDGLIMTTDPLTSASYQACYQELKTALARKLNADTNSLDWPLSSAE